MTKVLTLFVLATEFVESTDILFVRPILQSATVSAACFITLPLSVNLPCNVMTCSCSAEDVLSSQSISPRALLIHVGGHRRSMTWHSNGTYRRAVEQAQRTEYCEPPSIS